VREARQAILDYARLCGFESQETFEIALGAGEALANAVEHGNKALGFIEVSCRFANDELIVEVSDTGLGSTRRVSRPNAATRMPCAGSAFRSCAP
jgi:anti-sigma regulatory factor (Ser/Thr protein kinase)